MLPSAVAAKNASLTSALFARAVVFSAVACVMTGVAGFTVSGTSLSFVTGLSSFVTTVGVTGAGVGTGSGAAGSSTVTVQLAVVFEAEPVAEITAMPALTAVTLPAESTVATAVSLDFHVKVSSSAVDVAFTVSDSSVLSVRDAGVTATLPYTLTTVTTFTYSSFSIFAVIL
ncbi:hypothetical protein SDC9_158181 [bioreactor metagenome]|uniref:Uncharacterized protein n=1 Tax=bioreactor metagenome TaxID=1076179 RepID=A0A645FEG1_9ZZZZ